MTALNDTESITQMIPSLNQAKSTIITTALSDSIVNSLFEYVQNLGVNNLSVGLESPRPQRSIYYPKFKIRGENILISIKLMDILPSVDGIIGMVALIFEFIKNSELHGNVVVNAEITPVSKSFFIEGNLN